MLLCKLVFYIKPLWTPNHPPDILLPALHPQVEELGIWVHDWEVSLFSSEQFCALGRISPSVLPALRGGLGLVALDLAPSQLQQDFGTDDTVCLQDGKNGEESGVTG